MIELQIWITTGQRLGDQPTEEENALQMKAAAKTKEKTGQDDSQGKTQIHRREY